ncbi:MAG: hypothetical protein OXM03_07035 [Chloroflexota bacterium]|nr:hypothetical protein [Chloroflexota bacterium]MDE2840367.1 hypothetical protein [Chloroflexota bacterium]MDE2929686.1 hypothetical protein [Chloroflexota bacterium]
MLAYGALLLQLVMGGVFLLAAAAKLLHLSEFSAAVHGFGFVPVRFLRPASFAVPLLELLCGTLLITGLAVAWGVWLGIGLVIAFIVASSVALAQGRGGIDCYCFGAGGQPLGKATLSKQVVILALLAFLVPTAGPMPLLASELGADVSGIAGTLVFVIGAWAIALVAAEFLRLRALAQSH